MKYSNWTTTAATLLLISLQVQESWSFLPPAPLAGVGGNSNNINININSNNNKVKNNNNNNKLPKSKNGSIVRIGTTRAGALGAASIGAGAGAGAGAADTSRSNDTAILGKAAIVGVVTAAMGFLYGKILGISVKTVWKTLPTLLVSNIGKGKGGGHFNCNFNPVYFITSVCTFGGILVGLLSAKFGSTVFNVGDLVSSYSSSPTVALPSLSGNLMPLLVMSLITSIMGFSVGPEAPLCAGGALVGAALSRSKYFQSSTSTSTVVVTAAAKEKKKEEEEILAYAGAAGALTAFMGIPLAGSIFALEVTRSDAGISNANALAPSVMASISAIFLVRALLNPSVGVGGHFTYAPSSSLSPSIGNLSGLVAMAVAAAAGLGGACLGTIFHKLVAMIKTIAWSSPSPPLSSSSSSSSSSSNKNQRGKWKKVVLVKGLIGLTVGILSSYYPQTLFWGEGSLQTAIDGHLTPFSQTKHGLSDLLTSAAMVNPSVPFQSQSAALQVGAVKLVSIALACAGKFPGGIIFPLMFAAAPFAHAFFPGKIVPVGAMCLMASTQASVTRTPLATALILSLTASRSTELSVMLPSMIVSSYLGVFFSRWLSKDSYFHYND